MIFAMDSDETGVYPTIIDYFDRVWMPSAITRVPQSYCSEPVRNPSGTDLGRVWDGFGPIFQTDLRVQNQRLEEPS